ncbi:MAG: sigma-70 family RNA polymerase sigma factor [Acidimicrobiales bacterium]
MDSLTWLAHRARAGDRDALERLVRATYADVWRLCAGFVDAQSADDLAQEAFLRAVKALGGFRADAAVRTWLLAIARNTCLDELRSRSRRESRDRVAHPLPSLDELAAGDASGRAVVADLLSRLHPERRDALVLTQVVGLSYEEAAAVCRCPLGTIRSRVARARGDLLALLAEGGHLEEQAWSARAPAERATVAPGQ